MKQIGARQEAGRIGGIGSCGRPLCCASWMTNFVSVGTSAARYQDISLNPQKLAGQCAKLKCCLNFEVDTYVESARYLPGKEIRLETADNTYYHFKTDIFKKEVTYSTDKQLAANLVTIDAARAFEVIDMNKRGEKPLQLQRDGDEKSNAKQRPIDLASQDELTRFDKTKKKKRKKGSNNNSQKPDNAPKSENKERPSNQQQKGENRQPDNQGNQPRRNNDRKPKGNNQGKGGQNNAGKNPQQGGNAGNGGAKHNQQGEQSRPNRPPKAFRDNQEND